MLKRLAAAAAITTVILANTPQVVGAQEDETVDPSEVRSLDTRQPIDIPVPPSNEPVDPAGPSAEESDPYIDQAARLYRAAFGREGDAEGIAFWADRLREGYPVEEVARFLLDSEEGRLSSGDPIIDAYRWALGREPEPGGYAYWSLFQDPAIAVASVSDSVEHQQLTETVAPPARVASPATSSYIYDNPVQEGHPAGWADAGNGVWLPKVLLSIRHCESKDNYTAKNSRSTASGGYQFLNSSWTAYGHAGRYGVSRAMDATPAQQDEAALITWERDGTRPWYASRYCWS